MNNIMLDLETLDTKPSAIVLSIGMARFDHTLVEPIVGTFYRVLSIGDQEENERTSSESTMAWWYKQTDPAKQVLQLAEDAEHEVHEQLLAVNEFMGADAVVWGNGADFDNVLLASLFDTYELRQPWTHLNSRCYRTLRAVWDHCRSVSPALQKYAKAYPLPEREGAHHNALDDAVHQARVAAWILHAI